MTPAEGQELFNNIWLLVLSCYVIGLGIGWGVKILRSTL